MLAGGGQQLWDDLAANFDVKAMLAGHTGEQPCFVASRRVSDVGELAGGKVAVSGLARDVVRGFGLEPVATPVAPPSTVSLDDAKRDHTVAALTQTGWNITRTAAMLGT